MSGVSFVFATPRIERARISRAACMYSCLTRSSWFTRACPFSGGRSSLMRAGREACGRFEARSPARIARTIPATTSSQ